MLPYTLPYTHSDLPMMHTRQGTPAGRVPAPAGVLHERHRSAPHRTAPRPSAAPYHTAAHCTALHYAPTALHCTVPHRTAPHCSVLYCTALYGAALHCTAPRHSATPNLIAPHCTALCPIALLESTFLTRNFANFHCHDCLSTFKDAQACSIRGGFRDGAGGYPPLGERFSSPTAWCMREHSDPSRLLAREYSFSSFPPSLPLGVFEARI